MLLKSFHVLNIPKHNISFSKRFRSLLLFPVKYNIKSSDDTSLPNNETFLAQNVNLSPIHASYDNGIPRRSPIRKLTKNCLILSRVMMPSRDVLYKACQIKNRNYFGGKLDLVGTWKP